jgi:hypothetical protein
MDVEAYRGIGQFGTAYRRMYENDVHSPGSVDRVLLDAMVRLCPETADYLYQAFTPIEARYRAESRAALEVAVHGATAFRGAEEETVEAIARFCAGLSERTSEAGLEEMIFGGLEEEIIVRGSDWCTDVARVACVMCQVAGIPARLVILAEASSAYSGHEIIEAYREGIWGAVDPLRGLAYRSAEGRPVSTWDLMLAPALMEQHGRRPLGMAAIVNYSVEDREEYDYTVSGLNDYYRSILRLADAAWPGGLRWLFGEDR